MYEHEQLEPNRTTLSANAVDMDLLTLTEIWVMPGGNVVALPRRENVYGYTLSAQRDPG